MVFIFKIFMDLLQIDTLTNLLKVNRTIVKIHNK